MSRRCRCTTSIRSACSSACSSSSPIAGCATDDRPLAERAHAPAARAVHGGTRPASAPRRARPHRRPLRGGADLRRRARTRAARRASSTCWKRWAWSPRSSSPVSRSARIRRSRPNRRRRSRDRGQGRPAPRRPACLAVDAARRPAPRRGRHRHRDRRPAPLLPAALWRAQRRRAHAGDRARVGARPLDALGPRLPRDRVAASIATDLTRDLAGGEILMLHDADRYSVPCAWRRTLAALPAIIGDIRAAGLEFRPIG